MSEQSFTTKSGARVLGVKQDTLKHYARRFGIGSQPGGPGTPWLFTLEDLREIHSRRAMGERGFVHRSDGVEDRKALGLGPMFNSDLSPKKE